MKEGNMEGLERVSDRRVRNAEGSTGWSGSEDIACKVEIDGRIGKRRYWSPEKGAG